MEKWLHGGESQSDSSKELLCWDTSSTSLCSSFCLHEAGTGLIFWEFINFGFFFVHLSGNFMRPPVHSVTSTSAKLAPKTAWRLVSLDTDLWLLTDHRLLGLKTSGRYIFSTPTHSSDAIHVAFLLSLVNIKAQVHNLLSKRQTNWHDQYVTCLIQFFSMCTHESSYSFSTYISQKIKKKEQN